MRTKAQIQKQIEMLKIENTAISATLVETEDFSKEQLNFYLQNLICVKQIQTLEWVLANELPNFSDKE
jgi:hypothetical protein